MSARAELLRAIRAAREVMAGLKRAKADAAAVRAADELTDALSAMALEEPSKPVPPRKSKSPAVASVLEELSKVVSLTTGEVGMGELARRYLASKRESDRIASDLARWKALPTPENVGRESVESVRMGADMLGAPARDLPAVVRHVEAQRGPLYVVRESIAEPIAELAGW